MDKLSDNTNFIDEQFSKSNSVFQNNIYGTSNILPLWVADMDFEISDKIKRALKDRVEKGHFGYEVRQKDVAKSITRWIKRRQNIELSSDNILFMNNVLGALVSVIEEFTSKNDGVIIQPPVFHQFPSIIKNIDRKVVNNPLILKEGRYNINFDELEKLAKKEENKIILLCSPHNPIGRVWTIEEITQIAEIALKYDLILLSDEIHADIIFKNNKFNGVMSLPEKFHKNLIMVGSSAKTFGMPGISESHIYTENQEFLKILNNRISRYHIASKNALTLAATFEAYNSCEEWVNEKVEYFERCAIWIEKYLTSELDNVKLIKADGTYQLWIDFRELNISDEKLNKLLASDAGVGLTPGRWFGQGGEGFARINIGTEFENIEYAFNRIKESIAKLSNKS